MNNSIFINQIGYPAEGLKLAYVYEKELGGQTSFSLCTQTGKEVYTGTIKPAVTDNIACEAVCTCDFTEFSTEGTYFIKAGSLKSDAVIIGKEKYKDLYYSTLRYFYLSRCGQEIIDEKDNKWGHPACHTSDAKIYGLSDDKKVNISGGWHDAGDYGRYIVAGSKTVMDLLLAYEQSKDSFNDFDILDEVRFELEWMLKMQREDGAVYHKISCYHFCGFILPQNEKDAIVVAPVSTAATCDFAGSLAFASGFYKEKDSEFADKLLKAALKAQDYAQNHEDEIFSNPPEITTGCYGDWNVSDERYFALCSLFAATKNKDYLEKALKIRQEAKSKPENYQESWKNNWNEGFGWGSVGAYGTEILLKNKNAIEDKSVISDLEHGILTMAEKMVLKSENASFGLSPTHIFWGSNGVCGDEAHMMLLAYDICGEKKFADGARKNCDYILGCNPMNLCYVTGNGINSPHNPHHRQSGFLRGTMPGMLVGGPSAGLQDDVARRLLQGKVPLQCYADETGSYSTNEVAIYWNSPLVYMLAKLKFI